MKAFGGCLDKNLGETGWDGNEAALEKWGRTHGRHYTSTNLTVIMKASSGSGQSSCRAVWLIWAKQVDRSTADVLCLVSSPKGTSWETGEHAEERAQDLPNPCLSLPLALGKHRAGRDATRGSSKAPP